MASNTRQDGNTLAAIIFAVFAVVCVVAFLAFRGSDVGQLPKLVSNLGGGPFFGVNEFFDHVTGIAIALAITISWFGLGGLVTPFLLKTDQRPGMLLVAQYIAIGAAIWSLIWFFLGLIGEYFGLVSVVALGIGWILAFIRTLQFLSSKNESVAPHEQPSIIDLITGRLIDLAVGLSLIASLAPQIAKDTLLYHFAVPKAFIAQHSSAFIDGNIASYLALGAEMHYVWAMLAGGEVFGARVVETAAAAIGFMYLPILLVVIYGWARDIGISKTWAHIATLMVAAIPSAYHVASSGYIDLSLALYVTLAIYSLTRWWKEQTTGWIVLIGIFLGAALSIKLTTVFVIAAFALIILLKARNAENAARVVIGGFAALILACVIASPWYLRTWKATGSPVFPFYMSIWKGEANGWDVERSTLFQGMNTQYGGEQKTAADYALAPINISVIAQPEQAKYFDGVLGVAFLIGLPLLIWALWKFDVPVEAKIGSGVAAIMFLFWLFSSQQLRYLLPVVPVLAIAMAASAEAIGGSVKRYMQYAFVAAGVVGILTTTAWFLQKAPLRVVLGGETRDQYLTRNLDYYPYYQMLNTNTPTDAKVWLINMRRDTYNIERPVFSDYLFEDWTLRKMVWEARSVQELRAKAATMGVQYVLARHDFLFDFDKSTLVDDKRPKAENEAKLKIAKDFILDPQRTIKADDKFSLIKVF